jgi:hypothetical protein
MNPRKLNCRYVERNLAPLRQRVAGNVAKRSAEKSGRSGRWEVY